MLDSTWLLRLLIDNPDSGGGDPTDYSFLFRFTFARYPKARPSAGSLRRSPARFVDRESPANPDAIAILRVYQKKSMAEVVSRRSSESLNFSHSSEPRSKRENMLASITAPSPLPERTRFAYVAHKLDGPFDSKKRHDLGDRATSWPHKLTERRARHALFHQLVTTRSSVTRPIVSHGRTILPCRPLSSLQRDADTRQLSVSLCANRPRSR